MTFAELVEAIKVSAHNARAEARANHLEDAAEWLATMQEYIKQAKGALTDLAAGNAPCYLIKESATGLFYVRYETGRWNLVSRYEATEFDLRTDADKTRVSTWRSGLEIVEDRSRKGT